MRKFRLDQTATIKPFDCGDDDLNDFLLEESKSYQSGLLATTFVFEEETSAGWQSQRMHKIQVWAGK